MISLLNLYDQPQDPIAAESLPTELHTAFFAPPGVIPNPDIGQGEDDWIETEYQIAFFGPDRRPDAFGAAAFYPDHVLGIGYLSAEQQLAFFAPVTVIPNQEGGQSEDNWIETEQQIAWFGVVRPLTAFGAALAVYPDQLIGPSYSVEQQVAFFGLGLPIPNQEGGQSEDNWIETEQQIAWFGPMFQPAAVPFPWNNQNELSQQARAQQQAYFGPERKPDPNALIVLSWTNYALPLFPVTRQDPSVPFVPFFPPVPPPPPKPPPGPTPGGGFGGSTWSSATLFPDRLEEEFWLRNADRVKKMKEAWAHMPDLIDEDRDVFEKTAVGDAEETAATAGAKDKKKEEEPKLTEEQWRLRAKLRELLNPSAKPKTAQPEEAAETEQKTKQATAETEPSIPLSALPSLLLEMNRTQVKKVVKPTTIFGFSIPTVLFVGAAAVAAWWYFSQEPEVPYIPEPAPKPRKKKKKRKTYVEEE